jgi:hypothetical protein
MRVEPGLYRHFKGALYRVTGAARHSETEAWLVLYHPEGRPDELWVRPVAMWGEHVRRDGYDGPRFAPADEAHP